uniref:G-protein coupled receptors family 1 profile domain-containing protein n=1 Tax=Poecilia mexicana TaxID=48701 RepID=A0A3B3YIU6_9TELE
MILLISKGTQRLCCLTAGEEGAPGQQQHSFPWVATVLAGVLITTIVVDVIGNLLVIVSVFRNRKLRKAGTGTDTGSCWTV